jgi:hypothetical protein
LKRYKNNHPYDMLFNKVKEVNMSVGQNRAFTEHDLFLIQDYAQNHWNQTKNSYKEPSNSKFPQVNIIGNDFSTDKKKNSSRFLNIFVISALFTLSMSLLTAIPKMWGFARQYYFTRKITKLASKDTDNYYEKQIIEKLKKLIEIDDSKEFIRYQKVKVCSITGILLSAAAYLTVIKNEYADYIPDIISKKFPTRVPLVPDALNNKIISLLTKENLPKFSKAVTVFIAVLILNKAYNLYQNFDQTKHPKSLRVRHSADVMCAVNNLLDPPYIAHTKNVAIMAASAFNFK